MKTHTKIILFTLICTSLLVIGGIFFYMVAGHYFANSNQGIEKNVQDNFNIDTLDSTKVQQIESIDKTMVEDNDKNETTEKQILTENKTDSISLPNRPEDGRIFIDTYQGRVPLPDPPIGFTWQRLEEINGWALKPQNWYFRYDNKGTTRAYFVTKEEIVGEKGFFETGLSMNVVNSSGIPGGDAHKYGESLAESYRANGGIEYFNDEDLGDISVIRMVGTFKDKDVLFKMSMEIITNKKTNTLYLITFESSPNQWNSNWEIGKLMLSNLLVDDEV